MRLSTDQIARIREVVRQEAGSAARVRVFGGALFCPLPRALQGPEVDVVLSVPNLARSVGGRTGSQLL